MKRKRKNPLILIAFGIAIMGIAVASLLSSMNSEPEKIVEEFYKLEQEGNFGSSWELFHSHMKQRFNKDQYIQSRAHVFMQDMKVESFTFEIGESEKISHWQAEEGAKELQNVYKVPVIQTFHSQFGTFTIEQACFVTLEKDEWKLLWDYSEHK
jgi:hypothetical protein